ncbi:MAG: hypothetical protein AAF206_28300, partial [Bacteroidota bacterium]
MKYHTHKLIFYLFLCYLPVGLSGQDCEEKLERAKQAFQNGTPEQVETLLQNCLQSGFSKRQKIEAYRLLVSVFLLEGDPDKAQQSFIRMMKQDPSQSIDTSFVSDPPELLYLYNQFRTIPKSYLCISAGAIQTFPDIFGTHRLAGSTGSDTRFEQLVGTSLGINWEKALIRRNLRLNLGLQVSRIAFRSVNSINTLGDPTQNTSVFRLEENQTQFRIPIQLQYDFEAKKPQNFINRRIYPYIQAGIFG